MECKFDIDVVEPEEGEMMFRPHITFKLIQLNHTPQLITNDEIDFQVDQLIEKIEKLRKQAKTKLKKAMDRHGKLQKNLRDNNK